MEKVKLNEMWNKLVKDATALDEVVSRLDGAANEIRNLGIAFNKLCEATLALVRRDCKNYEKFFESMVPQFNGIANAHYECYEYHYRAMADLRDISARNVVLARLQKEIEDKRKKLDSYIAKQKTYEASPNQSASVIKNIAEAKKMKLQTAAELKDMIIYFQEYKKKYELFKWRRLRSCFIHYGKGLEIKGSLELAVYNAILILLRSIRDHVKDPSQIISSHKDTSAQLRRERFDDVKPAPSPYAAEPTPEEEKPAETPAEEKPAEEAPKPAAARGRGRGHGRGRGRGKGRKAQSPDEEGEIEIDGYMYDSQANDDAANPFTPEEEEKKEIFKFDDEDENLKVTYEPKVEEPAPFNPEIDESKLDVDSVAKELNLE